MSGTCNTHQGDEKLCKISVGKSEPNT